MPVATLSDRAVLEVTSEDRLAFLQGLISNDVTAIPEGEALWAALLTPQGKWLADFFLLPRADRLLMDAEAAQAEMVMARLLRFRLRSKVAMARLEGFSVQAGWGEPVPAGAVADPRLAGAGWRLVTDAPLPATASAANYDLHRLSLGLPDGSRDLQAEQSILLEAGFDELHGISWSKGCYMGQELTARTKYRGLVKRRLVPVEVEGPLPARGTPVTRGGAEVGEMRSGQGVRGMALLRLAALSGELRCGEAVLRPRVPAWMKLPESTEA
ncbi:folate-binding protein [Roseococcus sp. SYP-B2431]|uniref:CAF17-like 4Fe-4S cluster assembly/insertion protein YgfZ n=1 Tax=Roseococcus sp. SYP-B2431 TaxID=2496640 RepID=UPI00103A04E0|nr:folate-binding protein YgfZ [Roseococcus sp. SYP-B2431]TCH97457.1 folate-binding protein [Roseococcus sp. SYP-B2431]